MNTEHKTMRFKTEDYDESTGIFSGYGAVFGNVDSGGDIIEPGAFAKALGNGWERVKVLSSHNENLLPIGKPLELREDDKGLFLKAKISDTTLGRDIKTLLSEGVLNELSIGYEPVLFDYDEAGIRHLREVDLWEVSVVTWAMNDQAQITDYKSEAERAAAQARDFAENVATEWKEGRKISGARLKSLESASAAMKEAAKAIDALIREASAADGEKSGQSKLKGKAREKPASPPTTQGNLIEIYN